MKRASIISMIMIAIMVISACGGQPAEEPAISAEEIQSTAVAAAFTIVAETQAAIPTNTPLPPTETASPTPLPTDTPIPSPTLDVLLPTETFAPTQASNGGDPCNAPLGANVSGKDAKIHLVNNTKADIVVSLYLNITVFGECGFRGYNIGSKGSAMITDLPQGCYNVSVLINDPKKPSKSFGYGCINNPDKATFQIGVGSVKFGE
ncbi:MAG TPA: hypothetical protein VJ972_00375 [Anaerolineales bacterium]|nr:hypothetical protein [Anaerolineales bacterium]